MKKSIAYLLMLCLILSFMPFPAFAEGSEVASGTCGESLTWVLTEDGTLKISGYGPMTSYNGVKSPWYSYRSSIFNIVIDDTVTTIGDWAFMSLTKVTDISIGDGVTSIGKEAFENCCYPLQSCCAGVDGEWDWLMGCWPSERLV